ncbi:MAG: DUF1236 domain-containing protein [Pseudolabrys sp.]
MQNIRNVLLAAGTTVAVAFASSASAATVAAATTPLNIRSGPGPQYSVTGVIPAHGRATITGCIQGSLWCRVIAHGRHGWAYSKYLTMRLSGRSLIVAQNLANIPAVTYEVPVETVGSAAPVATVSGSLAAPATSASPLVITPPATVNAYVTNHPLTPVYLNGEVEAGAGLPADVALAPIPGYAYQYAYVNRVPVLVEPQSRTIAYVYR